MEIHNGGLRLAIAGGSETGTRYPDNYDVLRIEQDPPMVVVADGMGAGVGSATAGSTAVAAFVELVAASAGEAAGVGPAPMRAAAEVGPATVRAAVAEAQRRVHAAGVRLGELTGCTMTALLPGTPADPTGGWIVQIGDSRAYRLRAGVLELLTVDHTTAWLGAVYGWYPADSPQAARARYQLLRYVGHPSAPEPDVLSVTMCPGDVYCVCTDGLAEQVSYQRLAAVLGDGRPVEGIVRALLADSLAAGGKDNATLAVVRVDAG